MMNLLLDLVLAYLAATVFVTFAVTRLFHRTGERVNATAIPESRPRLTRGPDFEDGSHPSEKKAA